MPNNPTWIEPPPAQKSGLGCVGKGCLGFVVLAVLVILLLGGGYFTLSHKVVASQPAEIPIQELPAAELASVQQRVKDFRSPPSSATPVPSPPAPPAAGETPTPSPEPPGRQLVVSAGEINGLIAANKKSRGHASVSLSGNTATVQLSVPTDKMPGIPRGYLNGSFTITTDGPTPITALQVSKVEANGWSVPSGVLSMSAGGRSIMGYALEGIAPYNVSTAEIRDGNVILR